MTEGKTLIHVTSEGEKYYVGLERLRYPNLSIKQQMEFNILFDLILEGKPITLREFFGAGRDTIMGRLFLATNLEVAYVRVLHKLIKQGYVKAEKGR